MVLWLENTRDAFLDRQAKNDNKKAALAKPLPLFDWNKNNCYNASRSELTRVAAGKAEAGNAEEQKAKEDAKNALKKAATFMTMPTTTTKHTHETHEFTTTSSSSSTSTSTFSRRDGNRIPTTPPRGPRKRPRGTAGVAFDRAGL